MKSSTSLFCLIMILIVGCNPKPNIDKMNTDKIEYNFQDSSVPPQYHRSYDIIITASKATIKVDSYGTVLADTSYILEDGQFQALVSQAASLPKPGEDLTQGATGQKSYNIDLYEGEKNHYSLYWDSLSNTTKNEKVNAFIEKVKSFIPNLAELRDRPLKEE